MPLQNTSGNDTTDAYGGGVAAIPNYIENVFSTYLYTGNGSTQTIVNGIALNNTASWTGTYVYSNTNSSYRVADSTAGIGLCFLNVTPLSGYSSIGLVASNSVQFLQTLYTSGNNSNDSPNGVAIDASGNVYIAGRNYNGLKGVIAMYNSSGTLQWQRSLASTNTVALYRIKLDGSGNIYVIGSSITSYSVGVIAKYNSSGTIQWQRQFVQNTASGASASGISVSSSGNVYISGYADTGSGLYYGMVAKINTSGTLVWQRSLSINYDSYDCIDIDSSENVYAGGTFNQYATPYGVFAMYNSSGTIQWQRQLGNSIYPTAIAVDTSNNIYVGCNTGDIIKYNSSGTIIWWQKINFGITSLSANNATYLYVGTTGAYLTLLQNGTTSSGAVFNSSSSTISLTTTSNTDSTATGTDAASGSTFSTSSFTDAAGTLTNASQTSAYAVSTQSAVTSGAGLVWIKSRSAATDHKLTDSVRGATKALISNTTAAQTTDTTGLTAFGATGFTIGANANYNTSAATYVSWTFRKQPKFFDVVTYTGTGSNTTVAHNLGSVPGCIIVKRTDTSGNWQVYHNGLTSAAYSIQLNSTAAQASATTVWNSTAPTSTVFSVGTNADVNASGGTYVAYLFAHNAGGFGLTGTDNVITCGSYTGDGSNGQSVSLGYEPQWLLIKRTDTANSWFLQDNMRPFSVTATEWLQPNTANAESAGGVAYVSPTATGFTFTSGGSSAYNASGGTYIYIAIRRGPMKVPTDATKVFAPALRTGTNGNTTTTTAGFPVDLFFTLGKNGSSNYPQSFDDRLRGTTTLYAYSTQAESTSGSTDFLNFATESGVNLTYNVADLNNSPGSYTDNYFVRSPSFFDEVCFNNASTGNTFNHNLGVTPEFMIAKVRSGFADAWYCYHKDLGATKYIVLNTTAASVTNSGPWNNTAPTNTLFTVGGYLTTASYVWYGFATCAGVSKVGSYTGNGTGQSISCGFGASGARFILIKRTDSTGNWYYFNSADGLTSSSSPYILVNQTVAYTTGNNGVYASAGGFTLGATAVTTTNIATASYIFLAIA